MKPPRIHAVVVTHRGADILPACLRALEAETRPQGHGLPRRVIGINVIQNCYWSLFSDYVAGNLNPFCGHVLAGNPREATSLKDKANRLRDRRAPAAPISARLRVASVDAPPLRGKLGEARAR